MPDCILHTATRVIKRLTTDPLHPIAADESKVLAVPFNDLTGGPWKLALDNMTFLVPTPAELDLAFPERTLPQAYENFKVALDAAIAWVMPIITIPFIDAAAAIVWTNQPLALTEFAGALRTRVPFDLSAYEQCRLVANITVAGVAAATLRVEEALTTAGPWLPIVGATGPEIPINVTGVVASAWTPILAPQRINGFLRVAGSGGNATADPSFSMVCLQLRPINGFLSFFNTLKLLRTS